MVELTSSLSSRASAVGASRGIPFEVASVRFAFPGNRWAIPLRDPETGEWTGEDPEWTWTGGRRPVAVVAGSRPRVQVVFRRLPGSEGTVKRWLLTASGRGGPDIVPRTVRLEFGPDGLSEPVEFRIEGKMPSGIGVGSWELNWNTELADRQRAIGRTRHRVYRTLREPIPSTVWAKSSELGEGPGGDPDRTWVYLPVMHWTCSWAAGLRSDKSICDAILRQLPRSGLKYAEAAWDAGSILRTGGGYCGGWYRMFQAMAGAQGVRVERRACHVDWRIEQDGVMRWCALVVSAPGLNRQRPVEDASTFHDSNLGPHPDQPVTETRERRYRFWGHPGRVADGHCLNFLRHRGRWYLYDASFLSEPVALTNFHLPRPDINRRVPVEQLGNFQSAYLNRAVGHMLGSLWHVDKLYKTSRPDPDHPQFSTKDVHNGLSVKTSIIPTHRANITFIWTG